MKSALRFWVLGLCLSAGTGVADPPHPSWWTPNVTDGQPAKNFAPANVGQAKNISYHAWFHINDLFPDLGTIEDIGTKIETDLITGPPPILEHGWDPSPDPKDNWQPLLVGQLKALAYPFYYHLGEAGLDDWVERQLLAAGFPALHPSQIDPAYRGADGHFYPWTEDTSDDVNYAAANLGQLKSSFYLALTEDTDGDSLTDLWEYRWFGDLTKDGSDDGDFDGISALDEFNAKSSPIDGVPLTPTFELRVHSGSPQQWDVVAGQLPNPIEFRSEFPGGGAAAPNQAVTVITSDPARILDLGHLSPEPLAVGTGSAPIQTTTDAQGRLSVIVR